jgi:hypothetical protein
MRGSSLACSIGVPPRPPGRTPWTRLRVGFVVSSPPAYLSASSGAGPLSGEGGSALKVWGRALCLTFQGLRPWADPSVKNKKIWGTEFRAIFVVIEACTS